MEEEILEKIFGCFYIFVRNINFSKITSESCNILKWSTYSLNFFIRTI